MAKKEEVFPSTYYNSKAVAGGPILLTINFAQIEPVGEGANKTEKLVVHFKEKNSKLLVVTPTKWDAIALIAKSDDSDEWSGTQVVLRGWEGAAARQTCRLRQHSSAAQAQSNGRTGTASFEAARTGCRGS